MPGTVLGPGQTSGKANESRSCFHGGDRPEGKADIHQAIRDMIRDTSRGGLTKVMSIWVSV